MLTIIILPITFSTIRLELLLNWLFTCIILCVCSIQDIGKETYSTLPVGPIWYLVLFSALMWSYRFFNTFPVSFRLKISTQLSVFGTFSSWIHKCSICSTCLWLLKICKKFVLDSDNTHCKMYTAEHNKLFCISADKKIIS